MNSKEIIKLNGVYLNGLVQEKERLLAEIKPMQLRYEHLGQKIDSRKPR
ncbi:hypothetical protein [Mesobacillus harenae]|nr:hypothetical protein [Mesobacillus harenae]